MFLPGKEEIYRFLVHFVDPMLAELAIAHVEEVDAPPLSRPVVSLGAHCHQRRDVIIARQDVVDFRVEASTRDLHDPTEQLEHRGLPVIVPGERVRAPIELALATCAHEAGHDSHGFSADPTRSRQASPLRLENALQAGEVACCVMLEESSDERREDREAGRGRRADPEGHACTGRSIWLDEVLAGAT